MPIVKNTGDKDKLVAGRVLHPGESRAVTEFQAKHVYASDPDLEIVGEKPQVKEPAPAPVQPAPVKKGKGRKGRSK